MTALVALVFLAAAPLPMGSAPDPVSFPHFPDRLHAFVWRNWQTVPIDRIAETVGAAPEDILQLGKSMGLPGPPEIKPDIERRLTTTIIKHNWHLLPYDQLIKLLGWTPEMLAYHLREDDFLFVKLGMLKPKCEPITYKAPGEAARQRAREIAAIARKDVPGGLANLGAPPFSFIDELTQIPDTPPAAQASKFSPRFCFSYFGLTGDPFLGNTDSMYPDGYLAQLAANGVDGVWLQGVLYTLAPFPWEPEKSARYEERLESLRGLVDRARRYGIGVYLYLNEPRAMPQEFYEAHPDMKGVSEGEFAALCTSHPDVRQYLRQSIAAICKAAPNLKGFFTITASENLTNCYSHFQGANCPRCGKRKPAEVVAELLSTYYAGIQDAGTKTDLISWDWGWPDEWPPNIVPLLPKGVAYMSVSEWSIPIERGGIPNTIGEYSISVIGPGPRATRNWQIARDHGMRVLAKVQVGTTWELGSVPYVPAIYNVAQHMANLRQANVNGLMLSWTLGGYPSPGLEIAAELGRAGEDGATLDPNAAVARVAERRFGPKLGPEMATLWKTWSETFKEFPFNGAVLYNAPQHVGPSNLLWAQSTGYRATMVGFPYDDLDGWRGNYPPEIFAEQFQKMAAGFSVAPDKVRQMLDTAKPAPKYIQAFSREIDVAQVCAIHYQSVANQARFIIARNQLAQEKDPGKTAELKTKLAQVLQDEMDLARRLFEIQARDSRMGYEASNQYYYLTLDLAEKIVNCRYLMANLAA